MKLKKMLIIILMLFMFLNINICVYADDPSYDANTTVGSLSKPESDIFGIAKKWLNLGKNSKSLPNKAEWTSMSGLVSILWGAGIFVVLIAGTILGIKYMFSSVEEKANIKQSIMPYLIGAIIIIGALSIWKLCISVLDAM